MKHKDAYIIKRKKTLCNKCLKINTAEKIEIECKVYAITIVSYNSIYNYTMHYESI